MFHDAVAKTLERSFGLYDEFVAELPEPALDQRLPDLRSNSIGQQLWCVVGARESYHRAIVAGEWSGFSCSLKSCTVRADVAEALQRSAKEALRAVAAETPTTDRCRLIMDLVEHEAAHQGQLIRYLYGLNLPVPDGWKSRYALEG